jgi:hypothetical protein
MYKYVLVHTSNFVNSGFLSYSPVRFWIRGGTRRYKAVPESPVPLDMDVQGGTRPCTFMYFLVPPYPGVQDFLVLPCTSLYQFSLPCTSPPPSYPLLLFLPLAGLASGRRCSSIGSTDAKAAHPVAGRGPSRAWSAGRQPRRRAWPAAAGR